MANDFSVTISIRANHQIPTLAVFLHLPNATALSKIIHLNLPLNKELIPVAEAIIQREKDNAVKKIYQQALKKIKR